MIFVLLGTFPTDFSRPLHEIEKLLKEKVINEEVVVQSGHTKFKSSLITFRPFLSLEELDDYYKKADLIISQGGTGSIIKGLKLNKKIIGIPRLKKYNEVVDDHQTELIDELAKDNFIIPWNEGDALKDLLEKSRNFNPKPFPLNNKKITSYLSEYIDNL